MPPMKKQRGSSLGQSTISKFFGVDNSKQKTKKRDAPKVDDDDQPVKLTKLEISSSTTLRKGSVLSSATVDRIKQFSYQEDQPRKENSLSESIKDSDVPDVPFDVFQEKETNSAASVTISDDEEEDEKMEVDEKKSSRTKCTDSSKKTKYTPLEQQYLDFKREYPDAILFIECGYKYRLFGEDAQVASKILNIGCFVSHNFVSASIPTHRLSVHVRRLVANGQKVGVVKQTETAALKAAGDNKNTLFSRKLHALYTTSTLIGEDFNISPSAEEVTSDEATPLSGYLTCIYDTSSSKEKTATVCVGIISVNSTTGDVLYSSFDDTISRSLLESCLMQIDPVEIILPESALTERTMNLIRNFCDISLISNKKIRIEKLDDELFDYTHALKTVSEFFENCNTAEKKTSVNTNSTAVLSGVLSLPPVIICCISSLISYLSEFRLEKLLRNWKQWQSLSDSSTFMALNAAAVRNLEVLKNSVDGTAYGSLLWTLNFTRTKFGENLLKSWLTKPLKDLRAIEERQDAVMEVLNSQSNVWEVLKKLLSRLPNLEKLLCAAFYHRCTCLEFITLVKTLIDVKQELHTVSERITMEVQGSKIKQMISDIISLLENIEGFAENINEKAAKEEDKTKIFIDTSKYAEVTRCQADIKNTENKLNQLKPSICRTLRLPAFSYSTVMGQKYLIEVKNNILPLVPTGWMKMSSTKQVSRFRSPEVEVLYNELRQLLEELKEHCVQAWNSLLDEFSTYFYKYKKVIAYLAQLDCIIAFAKLAGQEGYCRPVLTNDEGRVLNIVQGRNPIVSKLLGETHQYVANDTKLDVNKRCMIVTGPNMGGKSSYVRQVALISILAQAGSYVPATEAQLPIFDGIYIRMGADDDVVQERRSTFFTEMLETSGILSKASHHSLVILDELGRGTSTHDGSAIAQATLDHLIKQVRCITLFVTHYPDIANQLQTVYPENILSCHMAFVTDSSSENPAEEPDVTFLYTIVTGIASQSYGINAAKLAGIESDILMKAKQKSLEFENHMKKRRFICSVVKNIMHSNIGKLKNLQLV